MLEFCYNQADQSLRVTGMSRNEIELDVSCSFSDHIHPSRRLVGLLPLEDTGEM